MDTSREKKIQKLQEKIEELDAVLTNGDLLEKETNKSYKRIKRNTIIASIALAGGITAVLKLAGFGFPFVKDKAIKYQDIQTTIDQDGNKTEEKIGYIYKENMEPNTLYNYSAWTSTVSGESYRYVEKYDLEDIDIDEMLTILEQGNFDFNSIKTEPEISKEMASSEEKLMELPKYEVVYNELDMQDFIYEYETNTNNIEVTLFSIFAFACLDSFILIPAYSFIGLSGYKNNFDQMVFLKNMKVDDQRDKYVKKLEKLKNKNIIFDD